jgi:HK97 gp10 family phage protein
MPFKNYTDDCIKKTKEVIKNAMNVIMLEVEGQAVLLCPVAKVNGGTLKNSIDGDAGEDWFRVGVLKDSGGSKYAVFVEYGTYKQKAQPFIRPSFDIKKIEQRFFEIMEKELK